MVKVSIMFVGYSVYKVQSLIPGHWEMYFDNDIRTFIAL